MTELGKKLFNISQAAFKYGSPWKLEQFNEQLSQPSLRCLTVSEDGVIVGFGLWQCTLDEAELLLIAVTPSFQGQKKGKELMRKSFIELREQGIRVLFFEVRKSNQVAISFYQSFGFEKVGMRKKYYHYPVEDAVIMSLEL